eukprot:3784559-Rhodomonas_salina.1
MGSAIQELGVALASPPFSSRTQHDALWHELGRRPALQEGAPGRFGFYQSLGGVVQTPLTGLAVSVIGRKVAEEIRKGSGDPNLLAAEADRVALLGVVTIAAVRAASALLQRQLMVHMPGRKPMEIWGQGVQRQAQTVALA